VGRGRVFSPIRVRCRALCRSGVHASVSSHIPVSAPIRSPRSAEILDLELECRLAERRVRNSVQPNPRHRPVPPSPRARSDCRCIAWGEGRGEGNYADRVAEWILNTTSNSEQRTVNSERTAPHPGPLPARSDARCTEARGEGGLVCIASWVTHGTSLAAHRTHNSNRDRWPYDVRENYPNSSQSARRQGCRRSQGSQYSRNGVVWYYLRHGAAPKEAKQRTAASTQTRKV
jgi:hypothetical protein